MADKGIVKSVVTTEKSTAASVQNRYVVEVQPSATKPQIAAAVEKKFGVHVVAVRTVNVKGETKYVRGTRVKTVTPLRKKAYVTVRAGERIEQV